MKPSAPCSAALRSKVSTSSSRPPLGPSWLVDVKGRHFPAGRQKQYWKNWSTRDDLRSLTAWQRLFGPGFQGLFVFAYQIVGDRSPLPAEQLFQYHDRLYGFVGITLDDYSRAARPLSTAWDTLSAPAASFRKLPRRWSSFSAGPAPRRS